LLLLLAVSTALLGVLRWNGMERRRVKLGPLGDWRVDLLNCRGAFTLWLGETGSLSQEGDLALLG